MSYITPVLVFLLGLWYFCLRILGADLQYITGDLGDARFINFLLEHGYQWIIGNHPYSFWNAPFMYPFDHAIAFSDNMLGTMPIYGLIRVFGFQQETAYQLWWIVICALNYWVAYWIVKRWFGRWDLAIIVAWIFAFTIFNMGQLNYVQMTIRFMVPVAFYGAAKLVETSSWKYLGLFVFGIVYQFYCVIYTGFFLLYFSTFFLVLYAIIQKKYLFFVPLFRRNQIFFTALIVITGVGSMLWLMLPYYDMSRYVGMRLFDQVKWFLPEWRSFFFPHHSTWMWQSLHNNFLPTVSNWWIQFNFAGMIPLLGLLLIPFLWIYWKIKKVQVTKLTLALTLTTVLILLFFIRTDGGKTLYHILFNLPGIGSMHMMSRFMHVQLFLILAGIISMILWVPKRYSIVFFALTFLDNSFIPERVSRTEKKEIVARRTSIIKTIEERRQPNHTAYAVLDTTSEFYITQLDAMTASVYVDLPTVNGYSSNCPRGFDEFFSNVNQSGLERWMEFSNLDTTDLLIIRR